MEIDSKVALVTGASRGIGEAVALALAKRGATLLLTARSESDLARVADACRDQGSPRVETLAADLTKDDDLDALIMTAVRQFDGFDILINNAGAGTVQRIEDVADDQLDHDLALNLRAPYILTQAGVKIMRRRGGGQIVQIASGLAYRPLPGWSVYAMTKYGLRGFTECVRMEVAKEGIKVGTVAPGLTETHFFDDWEKDVDFTTASQPEDVAHAVIAMVEQSATSDIREITVRNPGSP